MSSSSDESEGYDEPPADPKAAALEQKNIGNEHYKAREYGEAVTAYTLAIDLDPEVAAYRGNRAAALIMQRKYNQAIDDCRAAIKIDPGFTKAYTRMADCQLFSGEFKAAKQTLVNAEENCADDPRAGRFIQIQRKKVNSASDLFDRAKDHLANERFDEAYQDAKSVMEVAGDAANIQMFLVECMIGKQQYQEALTITAGLRQALPRDANLIYLRGVALYYCDNIDAAINHWKTVLRDMDPDNAKCHKMYKMVRKLERTKEQANSDFKRGKTDDAIEGYTEALAIDPKNRGFNAKLYSNRAAAYMRKSKFAEAKSDCDNAIALDRNYVKAYCRRGKCLIELERYEEAIRDYEKAQKLDEGNRDIARQLRDAKIELKKSQRKDYYKILGVDKRADERTISKAFKRAALKFHPDKNRGSEDQMKEAEAKFKDVSEAYEVLSDAKTRARYDSGADIELDGEHRGHGGANMADFMRMFGGMGGGGRGGRGGGGFQFSFG